MHAWGEVASVPRAATGIGGDAGWVMVIEHEGVIPVEAAGQRIDQVLAGLVPDYSRGRWQQWLRDEAVLIDGVGWRPRDRVAGGEHFRLRAVPEPVASVAPQAMALDVIHQDADLLVIDKPAGLVVHPGAGNPDSTLQNALLHLDPALEAIPRQGLVHRIDKDTSGLLVVARTLKAHQSLTRQLQDKTMGRVYDALVAGTFTGGGSVDAPIGRHPRDRTRMAVLGGGREAVTHYRIAERFAGHTLLRVHLETGRTHQIRVHMLHIGHPLVGDPVYGGRSRFPKGADQPLRDALAAFRRQALHAASLQLVHPSSAELLTWSTPRPADFNTLLMALRAFAERAQRAADDGFH